MRKKVDIGYLIKLLLPIVVVIYFLINYINLKEKSEYSFTIYMFFATLPYVSSNFSFPLYRNIGSIIIIIGLIILILSYLFKKRKRVIINPYLILILLAIIISSYTSIDNQGYISGLINFIYIFLAYFFISNKMNYSDFGMIIRLYKINGVILSIVAIIEFIITKGRVEVTFSNANYLAIYLVLCFSAHFFSSGKQSRSSLLLIIVGIAATQSRSAILALAIPFLILIIKRRNIKQLLLYSSVIIITFITTKNLGMLDRFNNMSSDDSLSERGTLLDLSLEMIKQHPLTGIGFNNFITTFDNYLSFINNPSTLYFREKMVTHNDFLKFGAELGLLGLIFFILFLLNGFLSIQKCNLENNIKLYLYSNWLILFSYSLSHNNTNSIEFWFMTSLATILIYKTNEKGITS